MEINEFINELKEKHVLGKYIKVEETFTGNNNIIKRYYFIEVRELNNDVKGKYIWFNCKNDKVLINNSTCNLCDCDENVFNGKYPQKNHGYNLTDIFNNKEDMFNDILNHEFEYAFTNITSKVEITNKLNNIF